MKKLLALSVLLILVAVGAIVPGKIKTANRVHEQRMFAVVDAIGKSFRSIAAGDRLKIQVYSPKIDLQKDRRLWTVTGIVGVSAISGNAGVPATGGNELFELFSAEVRNACDTVLNSACLPVDTLTIGGSKLINAGARSRLDSRPVIQSSRR